MQISLECFMSLAPTGDFVHFGNRSPRGHSRRSLRGRNDSSNGNDCGRPDTYASFDGRACRNNNSLRCVQIMSETLIWIIGSGGTAVVAILTFWMAIARSIENANSLGREALDKAASAQNMATAAIAKVEMLGADFNAARLSIESKISALQATSENTDRAIVSVEARVTRAVDDLGRKIDHLNDTLIRTLGEMAGREEKSR